MQRIINKIQKEKKILIIGICLVFVFFAGNMVSFAKNASPKVLGSSIHVAPTPTNTPTPTVTPVTIINNIYLPTQVPVLLTQTPTPTFPQPSPTPTPFREPTSIPTPTLAVTQIPTVTPTPTTIAQMVTIIVHYAGEHADDTYTTAITSGETVWQVVQNAIGVANLQYTDYGGDLGIFITGFNGVTANANQYYDFQVNGEEASVGVSSYTVKNNDVLQFVLTSF